MRINPVVYGVLVLAVFLGTNGIFQAAGFWSTSGKVTAEGEAVAPSVDDVETIKGWMTLDQITSTYDVSLPDLLQHFELPPDTPSTAAIKDLESELFSVTNLRTWLQEQSKPTGEPLTESNSPAPEPAATSTPPVSTTATPSPAENVIVEKTVTGKTTFQELLNWGVSEDAIQKVIGGELPALSTSVKDFVTGKGLEFSAIKSQLQAEVVKTE